MRTGRKLVSFDWVIKQLLKNKVNFEILEGFLSELLLEDIKIKGVLDSESDKNTRNDKYNSVNLVVENSKQELIIIGIRNETEYDYLHRIFCGASKLFVENMEESVSYSKVEKIISISIVYFDLGHGEDYIYKGMTSFVGLNKNDTLILNSIQQKLYGMQKVSGIDPEYYLIKVNRFDDMCPCGSNA
jgi:hypothetical protein